MPHCGTIKAQHETSDALSLTGWHIPSFTKHTNIHTQIQNHPETITRNLKLISVQRSHWYFTPTEH